MFLFAASSSFLVLLSSPFAFELESGPSIEPYVGSSFNDQVDPTSGNGGLRLSWLRPSETDAFVTFEIAAEAQALPTAETNFPKMRYLGEGSFMFYEVFNPAAFRLGLGGGVEYRRSRWAPTFAYRIGGGYYFSPKMGIYLDVGGRETTRQKSQGDDSSAVWLSLSAQFCF